MRWYNKRMADGKEDKTLTKEKMIKTVSCLGFANAEEDDPLYKEAYGVGKALAQAGYVVANGGGPKEPNP